MGHDDKAVWFSFTAPASEVLSFHLSFSSPEHRASSRSGMVLVPFWRPEQATT